MLLIAGFDRVMNIFYHDYFVGYGYDIETVERGIDCLSALKNHDIDLVVLDWRILWGGGEGVLAHMRDNGHFKYPPVVLLLDESSCGTVAAAFHPPVIRRLYKPVRLTILREAIATALETP